MARRQRYTVQQVVDACENSAGVMSIVAKRLGCDRSTIWWYAKRYEKVREALRQADEAATDLAEAKSIQQIEAGFWPAIRYRLGTKGKGRGYAERREVTGAEGKPVEIEQQVRIQYDARLLIAWEQFLLTQPEGSDELEQLTKAKAAGLLPAGE